MPASRWTCAGTNRDVIQALRAARLEIDFLLHRASEPTPGISGRPVTYLVTFVRLLDSDEVAIDFQGDPFPKGLP